MQSASNDVIFDRVVSAVEQTFYLNGQALRPTTRLSDDLRLRRFDRIKLAIYLEETFGVELSDAAVERFETVGDIALYMRRWSIGKADVSAYSWLSAR